MVFIASYASLLFILLITSPMLLSGHPNAYRVETHQRCPLFQPLRHPVPPLHAAQAALPQAMALQPLPVLIGQGLRPRPGEDDLPVEHVVPLRHDLHEGPAAGEVQVGAPAHVGATKADGLAKLLF